MEFIDVVKNRTATRKFSDKIVSKETIDKILEVGRLAPTAKNMQPQKIYVVESEEGLQKIDHASPCRYHAPVVLLVCSDKDIACSLGEYSTYEMDASIVATHLMLAATNYGVDNIWIEYFDKEKLKEIFKIPDNIEPVCLLPLGYKSSDYTVSINHNKRKSLDETVEYI